jgi:hypothetical protein
MTDEQLNILYRAWVLSHNRAGQVLEPWAYPDAHQLCEQGWLDRRIQDDVVTWWWSDRADLALSLDALIDSQSAN